MYTFFTSKIIPFSFFRKKNYFLFFLFLFFGDNCRGFCKCVQLFRLFHGFSRNTKKWQEKLEHVQRVTLVFREIAQALSREATLRGPDRPIPELCHEMDSLRPAVSKLQSKTERRLHPGPLITPSSLLPHALLLLYRPHRVSTRTSYEHPTLWAPLWYTFGVATVLRDILSALFVPSLDSPSLFVSLLFHKYLFLLSFVRSHLLLVHFLPWWISAREHLRSALKPCKKNKFYPLNPFTQPYVNYWHQTLTKLILLVRYIRLTSERFDLMFKSLDKWQIHIV